MFRVSIRSYGSLWELDNCTRVLGYCFREVAKCSGRLDEDPGGRSQLWNVLGVVRGGVVQQYGVRG